MSGLAAAVKHRYDEAKTAKAVWDRDQQLINEYVYPSGSATTNQNKHKESERAIRQKIYDNMAERGIEDLASYMISVLTPIGSRWLMLLPEDPSLVVGDKQKKAKQKNRQALDHAARMVERYLMKPEIGFHLCFDETLIQANAKGMGVPDRQKFKDLNGKTQLGYRSIDVDECCFEENNRGQIDVGFRSRQMTARQVLQEYIEVENPSHNLEDDKIQLLRDYVKDTPDKRLEVVQAMFPKGDEIYKESFAYVEDKPYASIHIFLDMEGGDCDYGVLRDGVADSLTFKPFRFRKRSGKTYGFGLGHRVLADVMGLQKMKRSNLKAAELAVRPPLHVPFGRYANKFSIAPAALNHAKKTGLNNQEKAEPIFTVDRVPLGVDREDRTKNDIREGLFLNRIAEEKVGEMSATETTVRQIERLSLLAPILFRIVVEFLNPQIEAVFHFLIEEGYIKDFPKEILEAGVSPVYISQLMKAQSDAELVALERFANLVLSLSNAFPETIRKVDQDEMVQYVLEKLMLPHRLLKDDDVLEQERTVEGVTSSASDQAEIIETLSRANLNTQRAAESRGGTIGI